MSSKPNKQNFNETAIHFQKLAIERFVWNTCLNCENWTGSACAKYKATPPPDVIVVGCTEHLPHIPF